MKTKWGNAKINNDGYYIIRSWKEGNSGKLLHRLIWEDFWGCEIPKGYVIHHRDHNPLNNCIMNLQLMKRSEHISLHHKGKLHSDEAKRKMSENHADYSGEKHPHVIYNLWDVGCVHYYKGTMFQHNREPNPCKCFSVKYNGKNLNIGLFHDFVTPEIINDMIKEEILNV